ncbi:MAG: NUDIX hydrolase [Candidatus Nanoarchaeia archaeon]
MTLPKNAKRVFKGILFDVYHWKQKQFDGSYATFEVITRKSSVQIIATVGNKIILLREEHPSVGKFISFPGGIIESKNTKKEALRELREETGMKPAQMDFLKKTTLDSKIKWNTYYYIAKHCKKAAELHLDPGERITPFLVSFREFVEITSREGFGNPEFSNYMFRLKQDKKKLEEFRKKIFGK